MMRLVYSEARVADGNFWRLLQKPIMYSALPSPDFPGKFLRSHFWLICFRHTFALDTVYLMVVYFCKENRKGCFWARALLKSTWILSYSITVDCGKGRRRSRERRRKERTQGGEEGVRSLEHLSIPKPLYINLGNLTSINVVSFMKETSGRSHNWVGQ